MITEGIKWYLIEDDTFEVLYDEYVRGKPCYERRITLDRLTILQDSTDINTATHRDSSHSKHLKSNSPIRSIQSDYNNHPIITSPIVNSYPISSPNRILNPSHSISLVNPTPSPHRRINKSNDSELVSPMNGTNSSNCTPTRDASHSRSLKGKSPVKDNHSDLNAGKNIDVSMDIVESTKGGIDITHDYDMPFKHDVFQTLSKVTHRYFLCCIM